MAYANFITLKAGSMSANTLVELTPDDALLFIEYQKRHAFMQVLEQIGAFDIKSGSLTIHFDALGGIGSVDVNKHYRP